MPQGQIRKGFFFYFGLFVLLLIAIFLVCLVVMMFNPGKTVLWMQYFTGNETIPVTQETDGSGLSIDVESLTCVEVNCSYAKVTVQNSNEYSKKGIYIVNNAKGFSVAANALSFDYSATLNGTVLTLDITEPNGFLYFSRDIEVVLSTYPDSSFNFQNIKLKVESTDGDVDIGGAGMNASTTVKLAGLDVRTGKGDVVIRDFCDTTTLSTLSVKTEEGNVYSYKKLTYDGGKEGQGLQVNCDATLATNKGRISVGVVNVGGNNLTIECKKGNVAIDYIYATQTNVRCVQGNYVFGKVNGNLSFENSEDSIIAPNIVADNITGNFTLSTIGNANAEPDIQLGEVGGNIHVVANKGSLDANSVKGTVQISSDGSFGVNLLVADNRSASDAINIQTKSGSIRLGYLGIVNGDALLTTTSGKVTVDFTNLANFTATAKKNDGSNELLADNKISVNIGLSGEQTKNPLSVNGGLSSATGSISITTNSSVAYNLVSADKLAA